MHDMCDTREMCETRKSRSSRACRASSRDSCMRDVWGMPRPADLRACEASDPAGHYRVLESGSSVMRPESFKFMKISRIYCKTTPYRLGLLMLSSPLVVRYVSIVLRVACDENSPTSLCQTFKMEIRVRVVRLPPPVFRKLADSGCSRSVILSYHYSTTNLHEFTTVSNLP
jgi:hypothetical protein